MPRKTARNSIKNISNFKCDMKECGCGGAIYGLGFLGALFYYLTTAPTFWAGVVGLLKAALWPAFLVYSAMKYLGM